MKKETPVYYIRQHCEDKEFQHIKIASFNETSCTVAEFEEDHRHEYYEIAWLKRGKGIHNIDMVDYPYSGSVLFLLSPGQMHRILPEEKADGYIVKFLPALFRDTKDMDEYILHSSLFDNIQAQPVIKVSSAAHAAFEEVFSRMDAEFNADEDDKEKMLLAYLKILITQIVRLKKRTSHHEVVKADPALQLFRNYKIAVEKHFRREHGVNFYSGLLSAPARSLNAVVKKYANKTAGELIADRIILEARRELYYSTISIKEIGYSLGFDDPAYFTRFFKKQTGLSPQEYKITIPENSSSKKEIIQQIG